VKFSNLKAYVYSANKELTTVSHFTQDSSSSLQIASVFYMKTGQTADLTGQASLASAICIEQISSQNLTALQKWKKN